MGLNESSRKRQREWERQKLEPWGTGFNWWYSSIKIGVNKAHKYNGERCQRVEVELRENAGLLS